MSGKEQKIQLQPLFNKFLLGQKLTNLETGYINDFFKKQCRNCKKVKFYKDFNYQKNGRFKKNSKCQICQRKEVETSKERKRLKDKVINNESSSEESSSSSDESSGGDSKKVAVH